MGKVLNKFKDLASVQKLRKHLNHLLVLLKRSAGYRCEEMVLGVTDDSFAVFSNMMSLMSL